MSFSTVQARDLGEMLSGALGRCRENGMSAHDTAATLTDELRLAFGIPAARIWPRAERIVFLAELAVALWQEGAPRENPEINMEVEVEILESETDNER